MQLLFIIRKCQLKSTKLSAGDSDQKFLNFSFGETRINQPEIVINQHLDFGSQSPFRLCSIGNGTLFGF